MNAVGERIPVVKAMTDYEESFIVANKIVEMKMLESGSYNDLPYSTAPTPSRACWRNASESAMCLTASMVDCRFISARR